MRVARSPNQWTVWWCGLQSYLVDTPFTQRETGREREGNSASCNQSQQQKSPEKRDNRTAAAAASHSRLYSFDCMMAKGNKAAARSFFSPVDCVLRLILFFLEVRKEEKKGTLRRFRVLGATNTGAPPVCDSYSLIYCIVRTCWLPIPPELLTVTRWCNEWNYRVRFDPAGAQPVRCQI